MSSKMAVPQTTTKDYSKWVDNLDSELECLKNTMDSLPLYDEPAAKVLHRAYDQIDLVLELIIHFASKLSMDDFHIVQPFHEKLDDVMYTLSLIHTGYHGSANKQLYALAVETEFAAIEECIDTFASKLDKNPTASLKYFESLDSRKGSANEQVLILQKNLPCPEKSYLCFCNGAKDKIYHLIRKSQAIENMLNDLAKEYIVSGSSNSRPTREDAEKIRKLVERDFSDYHLCRNKALYVQMEGAKNTPVTIDIIGKFRHMRPFTKPAIITALKKSKTLEVVNEIEVKPKEPLPFHLIKFKDAAKSMNNQVKREVKDAARSKDGVDNQKAKCKSPADEKKAGSPPSPSSPIPSHKLGPGCVEFCDAVRKDFASGRFSDENVVKSHCVKFVQWAKLLDEQATTLNAGVMKYLAESTEQDEQRRKLGEDEDAIFLRKKELDEHEEELHEHKKWLEEHKEYIDKHEEELDEFLNEREEELDAREGELDEREEELDEREGELEERCEHLATEVDKLQKSESDLKTKKKKFKAEQKECEAGKKIFEAQKTTFEVEKDMFQAEKESFEHYKAGAKGINEDSAEEDGSLPSPLVQVQRLHSQVHLESDEGANQGDDGPLSNSGKTGVVESKQSVGSKEAATEEPQLRPCLLM